MVANAVSNFSDYQVGGVGSGTSSDTAETDYWSLSKAKKAYLDYLGSKREEIDEQQDARRYRHGAQWTAEQVKVLKERKQPVVTFNRIGRKIAGVVGLIERLRQDPKAYPRTPKHEQGADLATAVLRYVLDKIDWKAKSPVAGEDAAVDGIGGFELNLIQGDSQDPNDKEIDGDVVEPDSFFYDPRSIRHDFSDARYMGTGKWVDLETAIELVPDKEDDLRSSIETGSNLTTNPDREQKWFNSDGEIKKVRLVDLWYRHKGEWCWCLFTGSMILMEGKSFLVDEKRKTICKYIMFSANVDHDGDRYGFVRDLKSAQDEMNHRRSKALHLLSSRRIVVSKNGGVADVEKLRKELSRSDGVAEVFGNLKENFQELDNSSDFVGQLKMLENSQQEFEHFGPNPNLLGQGSEQQSGRAIALQQQAGIAELGPFILSFKGWKIRLYRAIWNAVQQHWTGERWIRVTDDEDVAQFVQINGVGIDPATGQPTIVNAVGSLDVDIIMDEGPDNVNAMQDLYETLQQVVPAMAPMMTPPQAQAALGLLINSSPIDAAAKKEFREASKPPPGPPPPPPEVQKAQAELEIKRVTAQQDMQLKAKAADHDMSLKERQAVFDAALEADKHAREMDFERERSGQQAIFEREKMDREAERDNRKIDHEAQSHQIKLNHETAVRKEQTRDPVAESAVEALAGIATVGDRLIDKLDGLERAFLAPTKIIKDAKGHPIAAEKVVGP